MAKKIRLFLKLMPILFLTGCETLPSLYKTIEDVADDNAVSVTVSREAIQKQTDVNVSVDLKNNPTKTIEHVGERTLKGKNG